MTPLLSFTLTLMVFGGCLSAPSTTSQPPCAESEGMRNLLKRLSILEKLVRDLKGQCTTPCCGKVQSGADDPSSLKPPPCEKDDGCPGGCGGDERGTCVDGECHCKEGYMGDKCQLKTCPEDCNDQGRCINGRCSCFAGFSGLSCGFKACPNNCHNRGHCQDGVCACDPGFSGVDCSARVCPRDCLNRGRCENGLCICYEGYAGVDCSSSSCPNNCNQRGDCENGICMCDTGFTGVDCGFKTCLHDCNDHGKCEDGVCVCDSGYFGEDCSSRACPDDCNEQGQCVSGRCVCDPGFDGPDCGIKVCSPECEKRGRCEHGECVCDPGFTGPDCELTICPNDCHNQGQCEDGTCICNPGFAGPDCGIKDCPNKCSNRGRCQNGICICPAGFTGPDCSSRACPKNCSGNGQCINGKCICDLGFVGPVCGTRSCPAGCSNHGRCIRGTCVCSPGYSGVDCSVRSCPKNCHDRGRCEGGVCFCDPGFTGLDCGAKRCPNDCFDRGHCEDGVCVCDYGFTGRNCGTRTCPNDCYDRGRCEDGVCICITGFKGEDCSIRTCPNDCYDRGTCDSGICICNEGYKGVDCGLTTCPNDCHNQGQCEDGVCVCDLGYTGVDCSTRTCPNNCYKRGQCVDGDCVCNPGYTGVDCASKACPENCNGRGTCDDGKCICYSGYSGPNCGYRACPNNCYDRGQCEDGVCVCDSGYTDIDCGVRTCPGNCQNRGQCDDGVCICTSGYTGPDCGQRTCPWDCSSHGRCDNGKCLCDSGYVGVDCSIRACPESCNVHGECENGVCVCNPGFTGLDCSTKACPKNCNNNGQCVNGKCICNLGFSGPVCGARVCPANCNGRGKCVNGVCVCKKGFGGADCGSEEVDLVAVTGLRVTSQEEAAVTLEWDQPQTPPSSYDITFKAKKENGILTTTVDGLLITFYQTGLAPGEEYIVSIQPRQGSTLGPETSITARTRIETPRGLQVIEVTNVSMLIRWEKPQSLPDRYIVTLIHPNGKERKLRVPGKGDRIRVPGLDANTEYRVVLRAEKGTEHSLDTETTAVTAPLATTAPPYQAVVEVTTSPPTKSTPAPVTPRPGPPLGGLQVRDITSDSVTVVWKARPKMFDSFLIRYEDVTDGTAPKEISAPGDQREVTLRDLTQNTRYAISVFGIRGGKLSRPLKEEVTTDARDERPIPRLSPISVSEVKPDSFRLTWESIDGDFDAYVLQYGPIGGPNEEETLPGDQTSFLATGLASNVNYSVEIRGLWREGHSDPATTHVFTEKLLPPQLESLSPSDVHSDSVHLSWVVKGRDFDSFVLSYRDGEGRPQEVPLEGDIRSYDVKELKPAKKYKFTLYGLSDGKKSKPVTAEISTDKSLPPRLESFSASDIRSDSVRLSWLVDGGEFDSFLLLYRDPDGKSKELTLDGEQRTVAAEDLKPGKKYKFILYGITGGKRSKAAIVETSTVPKKLHPTAAPPALPRLLKLVANKLTKESVELSWMVEGKEAFDWIILQFKEPGGGMRELQIPGQETSTVVQGLIPSQTYEFSVYGIKGDKRGRPQTTDYITDPAAYDGPPILTGLYISPHGPHAIHLSWEAPQGSFDSFRVRYRVQGQDEPVNMATAEGPDRNLLLTDLQPDTVYSVTLHGIREGEERWSLQGTGKTGPLGLEPPKNLRFNDVAEKSATASWDPPNSETTTFKVSYQPAEGGEPESVSVSGTTTPLKRLTPGTRYEVTVVSVRGFEESTPLTDFFTTAGGGPRSLRAHDVTEVSALLRWEAPTGPVDRYLLTYRAENIPAIAVPVPGDKTELRLTSLHPRTEYFVSVQSSHGSVTSAPASTSFTTSADAPRDLTATQITARSALLTWKAPDTAPTGYLLTYQAPQGEAKEIRLLSNLTSFMLSRLDPTTEYRVQLHALRNSGSSVPISTSFTTGRIRYPFPRDCWEQRMDGEVQNGLFTIFLGGDKQEKMKVYCDMETDGGGWIVFQRRMDGSTDFYRDWADYRNGFGNITSEFWLGNTALHKITSLVPYELRVDLHSADDSAYALYDNFLVEPEEKQFRLQLGQYKGTAGDSLSYHNNMVFSTRDRDTQKRILPCAMSYRGAWWYRNCHYANLNGMYGNNKDHQGINWHTWKGFEFSIPFTEMKMRPRGVANRRRL
ncbi:tenascin-X isoform X2 [Hyperolius riggenbachi]|uniref:tenascin-X isoform X2 n=1 Tax=Hyperolius riggenbachi TaxID=752182 RepID=UPI0035A3D161